MLATGISMNSGFLTYIHRWVDNAIQMCVYMHVLAYTCIFPSLV